MPDLCQDEQTCLPTSTGNLIIWFAKHGYPKLLKSGTSQDEQYQHTVHEIMRDTDARFDLGTKMENITDGIKKYIEGAGYSCEVEYRGLSMKPFSMDWLKENDDPNKGFILLLSYVSYNQNNNTFGYAWNAGHAVTLVNVAPNMILIHDPAHYNDETGRKLLTPEVLKGGLFVTPKESAPVEGLALLNGSLLEAPPGAGVMLSGAICITMHPGKVPGDKSTPDATGAPGSTIAGTPPGSTTTPAKSEPATTGWLMWFFNLLFSK